MTPSSHLSDNLVLLAHETSLLMATAAGLNGETVRAASICDGWTRAHVLSHIARNADAFMKTHEVRRGIGMNLEIGRFQNGAGHGER